MLEKIILIGVTALALLFFGYFVFAVVLDTLMREDDFRTLGCKEIIAKYPRTTIKNLPGRCIL